MTEEKLAVSDFNREELLDILTLLYVQGDKIVTLNNKMQNTIKANRQLRLQQATKRKRTE
ncbi:conserved domain protein [Streptococcus constellatus subsp. pharyngis SK1060 = CCUG 46377]|uniref:Conserved domain protein n=1 Tax=Streptococcus constellatus subsp. pharyngis SK1060 = CCUG 46377 TaxID=1035184 RepID=F9P497_STRCV|nr:conserved domain protein [Streptococcus constellatus subsp. pharyngis SK1060 = CCUG 46377]